MSFKFENGDEVKDITTGFKGIIRSRGDYLTGCNRYGVQNQTLKKDTGKPEEWTWFDEDELVLIKKAKVSLVKHSKGCPLPSNQLPIK